MNRKLLKICGTFVLTVLLGLSALAQGQPEHRVTLSVAPDAKQIKFIVRLTDGTQAAKVFFGEGEDNSPIAYKPDGDSGMTIAYTFKKPSTEERQVVLDASELLTLRMTKATKQINGISCVFTNVINPRAFISRKHEYKSTLVQQGASIGANVTIVCGVTIGAYAMVGAGAVVTRDVADYALVYGSPARQHGWVSRLGHRLELDPVTKEGTCPESGERYRLDPQTSRLMPVRED